MDFRAQIERFLGTPPRIHPTAFIAPGATILGDVTLGEEASFWYHAAARGDINRIVIGPRANVQDGAVLHVADEYHTEISELVTDCHKAIVHACTVDNEVPIGMGAIILDGA